MSSPSSEPNIRTVVAADAPAIARVHVESIRATYPEMLPPAFMETVTVEDRLRTWRRLLGAGAENNHPFVVERSGEICGFVNCGQAVQPLPGFDSEIYTLYLLPEYQGRGWGRALFNVAFQYLQGAHFSRLLLWVLEANPARRFYEAMGGELVGQRDEEFAGVPVSNVAYGWLL